MTHQMTREHFRETAHEHTQWAQGKGGEMAAKLYTEIPDHCPSILINSSLLL